LFDTIRYNIDHIDIYGGFETKEPSSETIIYPLLWKR